MLIVNLNAPSNLPTILGSEIAQPTKGNIVGYMTSKHILTTPHRVMTESNPMWTIFKYENTLCLMVDSPPVISNSANANRNEWLFNYPPARDIVMRFSHLERIGAPIHIRTEPPLHRTETTADKVRSDSWRMNFGDEKAQESLQSIWSWLPVQVAHLIGIDSALYVMPPEVAKGRNIDKNVEIEPACFDEMVKLLRKDGYKYREGLQKRHKEYILA